MKNTFLIIVVSLLLFSCNSENNGTGKSTDSITTDTSIIAISSSTDLLDDLLKIKDENELKEIFGAENVKLDTVWGAEGMFYMGTKLFANTPDEVIINWGDTLKNAKITSVGVHCYYDRNLDSVVMGKRWKTKLGITLGTSLKELEKINEKEFTFSGLGWDYGGYVSSWNNGKLEKSGIVVTIDISGYEAPPMGYNEIVGDAQFTSSNPNAQKVNPKVRELYITNP